MASKRPAPPLGRERGPIMKLSIQQVAQALGTNLGSVILMRAKGARLYDPTFPPMTNGTFDSTEVASWKATKSGQLQVPGTASPTTPPNTASAAQGETK